MREVYHEQGRTSVTPIYFRVLLPAYFEGIDSNGGSRGGRGIPWTAGISGRLDEQLRSFQIFATRRLIDVETHKKDIFS